MIAAGGLVVSGNSIIIERADFQSFEYPVPGRFLIVLHVFVWADSINERDEADGGGLGGLNQPAAGGRD